MITKKNNNNDDINEKKLTIIKMSEQNIVILHGYLSLVGVSNRISIS